MRLVRSQLVPLVLAHLRSREIDMTGLELANSRDHEIRLELTALLAFMEECRKRTSPSFGVELAEARPLGSLGLVEFFWRSSATMREGLATLAAHTRLLNDVTRMELAEIGKTASFVQCVDASTVGMGQVANEFFVVTLVREVRSLVSPDFTPTRVRLAHPRPSGSSERLFGAAGTKNVVWGDAATGMDFDARWLDAHLLTADPSLATALRTHTDRWLPWVSDPAVVEGAIEGRLVAALHLRVGKPVSVHGIAREIGVSSRTLQRRLAERGMTFQRVVDGVHAEHAAKLVEGGGAIKQIASRLGYASSAAFVRAFRRWTGMTPTSWRDRQTKRRQR